eukprot:gb/GECG01005476.1/.p1 GENE.gb/GECG01005476.1/~~gb/GECG01005476.1/.p1  ORF type:complete len:948 (+),score=141.82 gb/GECG01005476.1/:1-2844(+)
MGETQAEDDAAGAANKNSRRKEEQQSLLKDISNRVEVEALQMQRAVDQKSPKDALKYASAMLAQLKTGKLSPKTYFELYMQVFDHLMFLESFFEELHDDGTPVRDLYEMVQHASNVLTRLYLMITVGSVFIKSKELPAKDVLYDLLDMAKGVQHPTRGLFLRYYLFQKTQDKLPEANSEYEGAGGSIKDAIQFALGNFIEMNKLWVRMQTATSIKNRKRREKERRELRTIIGTAIDRIGNIEGLHLSSYEQQVLPELLRQVAACNDKIAQQFLMDSITQVFPVSFHVKTLDMYLRGILDVLPDVDARSLLTGHLERISEVCSKHSVNVDYEAVKAEPGKERTASTTSEEDPSRGGIDGKGLRQSGNFQSCCPEAIPLDSDCFNAFYVYVQRLIADRSTSEYPLEPVSIIHIFEALTSLVKVAYSGNVTYIEEILSMCALALEYSKKPVEDDCCKAVEQMFISVCTAAPLKKILKLEGLARLMGRVHFSSQKNISRSILRSALGENKDGPVSISALKLEEPEEVDYLFGNLSSISQDERSLPENAGAVASAVVGLAGDVNVVKTEASETLKLEDTQKFVQDQRSLSRVVHLVIEEDAHSVEGLQNTDNVFQILKNIGKALSSGGEARIAFTYPALITRVSKLTYSILKREEHGSKQDTEEEDFDQLGDTASKSKESGETGDSSKPKITSKKAFKFLFKLCDALKEYRELAIRLLGEVAIVAAATRFAYEFLSTAFTVYEEVVESKVQRRCIEALIGYIYSCRQRGMPDETYTQLASAAKKYATGLMQRQAQCQLMRKCANLFYVQPTAEEYRTDRFGSYTANVGTSIESGAEPLYRDDDQVLKCLQHSLRLANKCIPVNNSLFVEIFDAFVYFFEHGVQSITNSHLENFVTLIQENLGKMEDEKERRAVERHFHRVMDHLRSKKQSGDAPCASLNLGMEEDSMQSNTR